MNNLRKRPWIRLLLITFIFALVFSGCAFGGGSDSNLLSLKFYGKKYDLRAGLLSLVENVSKNGKYVLSSKNQRILAVEDGTLKYSSDNLMEMLDKRDQMLECNVNYLDNQQVFELKFRKDGNLSKVTTADGFSSKSKKKDVPDYFISVGSYDAPGGLHSDAAYMAVIVDGKAYDLSSYVKELPEEATDEYLERMQEKRAKMRLCSIYLLPASAHVLTDRDRVIKFYAEEEFRNVYAITDALCDLYESYQEGEITTFGTIGIGFDEKGLSGIEYSIFSEKEDSNIH